MLLRVLGHARGRLKEVPMLFLRGRLSREEQNPASDEQPERQCPSLHGLLHGTGPPVNGAGSRKASGNTPSILLPAILKCRTHRRPGTGPHFSIQYSPSAEYALRVPFPSAVNSETPENRVRPLIPRSFPVPPVQTAVPTKLTLLLPSGFTKFWVPFWY